MELKDKIVVITGAGSGIGRALAHRFAAEGAKHIVAVDINAAPVQAVADELQAAATEVQSTAMTADVSKEEDIRSVIERVEDEIGAIDLFCSNAGVGLAPAIDSPNEQWQASWDINVMAHVYAARHLVPRMVKRGGGYFMHTASAAGLLNQIGGAAYGVTKHAAIGFGEWLAIHHAHEGIKVSMLCPQAVRTAMTDNDEESTAAAANDGMIEPEQLADVVVEELRKESFLILPHPEVLDYMRRKTSDYDRWIGGMNRLMNRLRGK
ncbi:MAG: SDR family NAD(P)-dependent oxidoreductase [Pseudomonadales bacterium]